MKVTFSIILGILVNPIAVLTQNVGTTPTPFTTSAALLKTSVVIPTSSIPSLTSTIASNLNTTRSPNILSTQRPTISRTTPTPENGNPAFNKSQNNNNILLFPSRNSTNGNSTMNTNTNTTIHKDSNLKIQLVPEGKLQLEIVVKEEMILFTVNINLTNWVWWESIHDSSDENNKTKTDETNATGQIQNDMTLKAFLIGFEPDDNNHTFVDVVSISLVEDDEKDSHIKDSHWSRKNRILVPDSAQNYELLSMDVGKTRTIFSIKFSRPWLTCDYYDFQFTNTRMKIWWLLDAVSRGPESEKSPNPTTKLGNLVKENPVTSTELYNADAYGEVTTKSKPTPGSHNETNELSDEQAKSKHEIATTTLYEKEKQAGKKIGGKSNPSHISNSTMGKEVEILRSLKHHEFNGPFIVTMKQVLNNFSYVVIRKCKSSDSPSFKCTWKELASRNLVNSNFYITKGILRASSTNANITSDRNKIANFCPSDYILHGNNSTIVNALTSTSDKRKGKSQHGKNKGSRTTTQYCRNWYNSLGLIASVVVYYYG